MKVAVLMGGLSKEREISFRSGKAVAGALAKKGHKVTEIDADAQVVDKLKEAKPEAAFIMLHGKFGEDGTIQGILEWMRIPYTGPSLLTSAICFDKLATKEYLAAKGGVSRGIVTPEYEVYRHGEDINGWLKKFKLGFPCVVKPNTEGSSIGISRVYEGRGGSRQTTGGQARTPLAKALEEALKFDRVVLAERMIEGREITVGVHRGCALPIVEVVPKSGFYDYEAKYTLGMTEYIVPAKLSDKTAKAAMQASEKIYRLFSCEGAVRIDYMLSKNEELFFLEVNTIPGMTETSLLPKAAVCAGLNFEDLCEEILEDARLKIEL